MRSNGFLRFLSQKFFSQKKSEGFIGVISRVSIAGVALGVLALTVVLSVINGFQNELSKSVTGLHGEILVYTRAEPIVHDGEVEQKIRQTSKNVEAITSSLITELMIYGPHGAYGAVLEGLETQTYPKVLDLEKRLVEGTMPKEEGHVVLGKALAEKIGVSVGSEVRLILPFVGGGKEKAYGFGEPKLVDAVVSGIVELGMYQYDSKFLFSSLEFAQKLVDQKNRVTTFKIKFLPNSPIRDETEKLSEQFGYPLHVRYWGQLNRNLMYAIELEKKVIAIILAIIVMVAAFNIVSTLMMLVQEKSKQVSILKAMGMKQSTGFKLYSSFGIKMGVLGAIVGVIAGLFLLQILKHFSFIDLPAEVYRISYLPVWIQWGEITVVALGAVFLSFFATLYPALKVARQSPVEGIRNES